MKLISRSVENAGKAYDPDGYPDILIKYGNCPDCGRLVTERLYRRCPKCKRSLDWEKTEVIK